MTNKRLIIFLLSLLGVGVFAQEPPRESIVDFSGGLNTNDNPYAVGENEFYQCKNFVLDDPLGSLSIRPGIFVSVDSLPLADVADYFSLHAHRFTDGRGYLFANVRRYVGNAKPYGVLRNSDPFKYDPFLDLDTVYPGEGNWLTWLDYDYYFDGRSAGKVVSRNSGVGVGGFVSFPVTPPAPGGLSALVLDSTGNLKGEYLWAYQVQIPCSSSYTWSRRCGPLSRIVSLKSQIAKLTGFTQTIFDSNMTCGPRPTVYNVRILRTKGNRVNFEIDSLFVVDSFSLNEANLPNVAYVDNISDATIATKPFTSIRLAQKGFNISVGDFSRRVDTDRFITGGRIGWASTNTQDIDTMFNESFKSVVAYSYFYIDTLTGAQGDTSSMFTLEAILIGGAAGKWKIRDVDLRIPPSPSGRYWRVLLRLKDVSGFERLAGYYPLWTVLDTITVPNDTTWVDRNPDSILTKSGNSFYNRLVMDANPIGAIVHESRMWTWDDHRVYFSNSDTAANASVFNNLEMDLDDGDRVIGAASFDGYVIIYKTRSTWIVYTADGEIVRRQKKSVGWGMASFASLSSYAGNNIFLSPEGILYEAVNPTLDRAVHRTFITDQIKNIFLKPMDQMLNSSGRVFGDRYYFSHEQNRDAGEDTSFVYFFKTGGWGTFDFAIRSPVLYDTLNRQQFSPFNELVFLGEKGNPRIYRLSLNDSIDVTSPIVGVLEKRHLGLKEFGGKSLQEIGISANGATADTSKIQIAVYEDLLARLGDSLGQVSFDSLNQFSYDRQFFAPATNRVINSYTLRLTAKSHTRLKLYGIFAEWINAGVQFRR